MRRALAAAALFVTALSLGASWSHVLQIRGKAAWDGPFWRTAMETLYRDYAVVGAFTELGAILLAWLLVLACRRDPRRRRWAVAGALLLSSAFGLWLGFIAPINAVFAGWTPEAMPAGWTRYRDRWELWHAVIAAVKALAFLGLLAATLSRDAAEPTGGSWWRRPAFPPPAPPRPPAPEPSGTPRPGPSRRQRGRGARGGAGQRAAPPPAPGRGGTGAQGKQARFALSSCSTT